MEHTEQSRGIDAEVTEGAGESSTTQGSGGSDQNTNDYERAVREAFESQEDGSVDSEESHDTTEEELDDGDPENSNDDNDNEEDLEEAEDSDPILPPERWSDREKELFKTASPELQEVFSRRTAYDKQVIDTLYSKTLELKQERDTASSSVEHLKEILTPVAERLGQEFEPAEFLEGLTSFYLGFSENPIVEVTKLLTQNGISLEQYFQATQQLFNQGQHPEAFSQELLLQKRENEALRREKEQRQSNEERYREQQQLNSLRNESARFAQSKDEAGNPLYPHLKLVAEELTDRVVAEINRDPNQDIQVVMRNVYDYLTYHHPEIKKQRETQQIAEKVQREAKRLADAKRVKRVTNINEAPSGKIKSANSSVSFEEAFKQEFSKKYG
jgi:hypothetical protein